MLACPFGDCRESQMPRHLREYLECRLQNNEMGGNDICQRKDVIQ